jgi:hypothetical protein
VPLERTCIKARQITTEAVPQDAHFDKAFQRRQPRAIGAAEAIEIVPPRENSVDALAVETLLAASLRRDYCAEIAGDYGAHFILRGTQDAGPASSNAGGV